LPRRLAASRSGAAKQPPPQPASHAAGPKRDIVNHSHAAEKRARTTSPTTGASF
jgi:hypothetical protein